MNILTRVKVFLFRRYKKIKEIEIVNLRKNNFGKNMFGKVSKGSFLTIHKRPINAADVTEKIERGNMPRVAIVMQGPLVEEYNFTIETIKIYQKIYPFADVVVSTWKDTTVGLLERLKELKVEVVLSSKPECSGIGNANFQIVSSNAGITRAKELGYEYVCKTRTDQRLYNGKLFDCMMELLKRYPVLHTEGIKERIITLNFNTFRKRCYGVSDFFQFGRTDDILKYWSAPLDERDPLEFDRYCKERELLNSERLNLGICETYFASKFLESLGHNLKWNIEDSEYLYAKYFIILDKEYADIYWPKYSCEEFRWKRYVASVEYEEFMEYTFLDWLMMYERQKDVEKQKA